MASYVLWPSASFQQAGGVFGVAPQCDLKTIAVFVGPAFGKLCSMSYLSIGDIKWEARIRGHCACVPRLHDATRIDATEHVRVFRYGVSWHYKFVVGVGPPSR